MIRLKLPPRPSREDDVTGDSAGQREPMIERPLKKIAMLSVLAIAVSNGCDYIVPGIDTQNKDASAVQMDGGADSGLDGPDTIDSGPTDSGPEIGPEAGGVDSGVDGSGEGGVIVCPGAGAGSTTLTLQKSISQNALGFGYEYVSEFDGGVNLSVFCAADAGIWSINQMLATGASGLTIDCTNGLKMTLTDNWDTGGFCSLAVGIK